MHNWAVIYNSKKRTRMFTNSNEAKSAAGSKGHSPTINGLFYTIPNYMKETNKQKKNTSTNLYIQV